jgi:hypothetical protein
MIDFKGRHFESAWATDDQNPLGVSTPNLRRDAPGLPLRARYTGSRWWFVLVGQSQLI